MNKQFVFRKLFASAMLATGIVCVSTAQASLTASADGTMIHDSNLNITWLADTNYAFTSRYHSSGNMSWDDANTWVANLNLGGNSNWRLPTLAEMEELRHELGGTATGRLSENHNLNYTLFSNFNPYGAYWTDTIDPTDATKSAIYSLELMGSSFSSHDNGFRAMAVSPVPEPETYAMLLAGLSLVGFIARRRKQAS
jgi:hypothetical protein